MYVLVFGVFNQLFGSKRFLRIVLDRQGWSCSQSKTLSLNATRVGAKGEVWGGVSCFPMRRGLVLVFFIFELKMVRFGAFWVPFFSSAACFTRKITAEFDEGNGISATLAEHSA